MKVYCYQASYLQIFIDSTFPMPRLCDLLCHLLKLSITELPKSNKEMMAELQMAMQLCKAAGKWLVYIINLSVAELRGVAGHLFHLHQLLSGKQKCNHSTW